MSASLKSHDHDSYNKFIKISTKTYFADCLFIFFSIDDAIFSSRSQLHRHKGGSNVCVSFFVYAQCTSSDERQPDINNRRKVKICENEERRLKIDEFYLLSAEKIPYHV